MGAQATYKWRYPETADPVRSGATNMQNIVNDIGKTMNQRLGSLMVQAAHSVVSPGGNGEFTITFPVAFAATPSVTFQPGRYSAGADACFYFLYQPQVNYGLFTGILRTAANGPLTSGNFDIYWQAIGLAPTLTMP
jgi:hypothetical protein